MQVTSFHCRLSWGPRQPPESQVFSMVLHVSKHPQLMVSVQKLEKFCCSSHGGKLDNEVMRAAPAAGTGSRETDAAVVRAIV